MVDRVSLPGKPIILRDLGPAMGRPHRDDWVRRLDIDAQLVMVPKAKR